MLTVSIGNPSPQSHESLGALKTNAEFAALGKVNLTRIITELRREEKSAANSVKYRKGYLETLKQMPDIPTDFVVDGVNLCSPLSLDAETLPRFANDYARFGQTSFAECGSCAHWSQKSMSVKCKFTEEFYPYTQSCAV